MTQQFDSLLNEIMFGQEHPSKEVEDIEYLLQGMGFVFDASASDENYDIYYSGDKTIELTYNRSNMNRIELASIKFDYTIRRPYNGSGIDLRQKVGNFAAL